MKWLTALALTIAIASTTVPVALADNYKSNNFTLKDPLIGGGLVQDAIVSDSLSHPPAVAGAANQSERSRTLLIVSIMGLLLSIIATAVFISLRKNRHPQ